MNLVDLAKFSCWLNVNWLLFSTEMKVDGGVIDEQRE